MATAYVWTDHLNTPRELTRLNSTTNGHVSIWRWDSLPFGETEPNGNPSSLGVMTFNHRFPGQYRDGETGLYQNWHREYDARLGRYVQSDPLGLSAGPNTFSYVFASPINGHDKLGLCTIVVVNQNGLGHAGVYVDNGPDGKPFLYDPGGSFQQGMRGSNDAFYGKDANISDYIKFQERDGPNVKVFKFDTSKADEAKIASNAEGQDGKAPLMCAVGTSSALQGVGPFRNLPISLTPRGLAGDLSKLVQGCKGG
jgi:RHS repeat-associated protein